MKYIVTGGAGFIGSHLVDTLIEQGHAVVIIDNLTTGSLLNVHRNARIKKQDIMHFPLLMHTVYSLKPDGIFHCAAMARTSDCVENPLLCSKVNAQGTMNVLEAARLSSTPRVVLSSSSIVYGSNSPYKVSKEIGELWGKLYNEMYGVSNVSLRYSNVYGSRQSEEGAYPNVLASFRRSKREKGYIEITGDGKQSRNFTHVKDIVKGQILAMNSSYIGEPIDLCNEDQWCINDIAPLLGCFEKYGTVKYVADRVGDTKHILQDAEKALHILGWKAGIKLTDGIKDYL